MCISERIFKIGRYLAMILTKISWHLFIADVIYLDMHTLFVGLCTELNVTVFIVVTLHPIHTAELKDLIINIFLCTFLIFFKVCMNITWLRLCHWL